MEKHRMEQISVAIPKGYLDDLDDLVKAGMYPNRSEAVRLAIRDLVLKEERRIWRTKPS